MKFDVIVGNPPYNGPKNNSCNTDTIYPKFVDYNIKIAKNVILITPARWFKSNNNQYKNHRNNMIHNYGMKTLEYIENGKYFENVDVKGGYSLFWCQEGYTGDVEFIVNGVSITKDFKSENIINIDIFVGNIENKIKIKNDMENNQIVSTLYKSNGHIKTNDSRLTDVNEFNMIKCHCSRNRIRYIKSDPNFKNLNTYKVITPLANSNAYEFKKDFRLISPNEMVSESFCSFLFETENVAKKFINFITLDLNIFLIKHNKPTQAVTSQCFSLIPQKWDTIQTNEDLYKYYNLTQEEIEDIKNNI